MEIELRRIALPDFGSTGAPPLLPAAEYEERARTLYRAAEVDWVLVYGDREHAANLTFLSGFDPRFEEALLALGPGDRRVLVVGNEGAIYAALARLTMDVALCQSFSLLGQPRDQAPRLADVLRDVGITHGSRVGVVGWKYLEPAESDEPGDPSFVPSFIVSALRALTAERLVDSTAEMMDPVRGLRARNSAAQIAAFEWAAVRASLGVMRIVRGAEPGMSEFEAVGNLGYEGDPLSCHLMFASGSDRIIGLRSPTARRILRGDGASTAVGYQGSLCCRAGLVTEERDEAFFAHVVEPYYAAIATWYSAVGIGVSGSTINDAVMDALANAEWRPMLNPGHQISLEEWMHTPIRPGSDQAIGSGMALQSDIIPFPMPSGWTLNCEDTAALADESLREELASNYPEAWDRIIARQRFMRDELGVSLGDDVLPLSASPAYLPPFWLDDSLVCAVRG